MPNFGDARKTLAKEASWEPEPEPEETEEEREQSLSGRVAPADGQAATASSSIARILSSVCNAH